MWAERASTQDAKVARIQHKSAVLSKRGDKWTSTAQMISIPMSRECLLIYGERAGRTENA